MQACNDQEYDLVVILNSIEQAVDEIIARVGTDDSIRSDLARKGLDNPSSLEERFYARLLAYAVKP